MTLTPPRQHQKVCIELGLREKKHCLFLEPGLGKTLTVCHIFDALLEDIVADRMDPNTKFLIVAPRSVMNSAWTAQWVAHGFKEKWGFPIEVLWRKNGAMIDKIIHKPWRIGVINIESFRGREKLFQSAGVKVLVVDESTKIKNESSKSTKSVKELAWYCSHVYMLSGCPAPNDESELYPQITAVNHRAFDPYHNYWKFFNEYFYQPTFIMKKGWKNIRVPSGRPSLLQPKAASFWERVKRHAIFIKKEDALDLPEKVDLVREVALGDDEMDAYLAIHNRLSAEINGQAIDAKAAGRIMKLRQITSGVTYTEDEDGNRQATVLGSSKLNELVTMLTEELHDKSVIVWGTFQVEIERIKHVLSEKGISCEYVHGGVGQNKRDDIVSSFISGKTRVLVAHPGTLGHGTDGMQNVCHHAIYYSLDYSYDTHNQSRDRTHRGGQNNTCFYHYLIVPHTIDSALMEALEKKSTRAEVVSDVLGMNPKGVR